VNYACVRAGELKKSCHPPGSGGSTVEGNIMNTNTHTPRIRCRRIAAMLLAAPALVAGALVVAAPAHADDQWVGVAASDVNPQNGPVVGGVGYGPTQDVATSFSQINCDGAAFGTQNGGCYPRGAADNACAALAVPPNFSGQGAETGTGPNLIWADMQASQQVPDGQIVAQGCAGQNPADGRGQLGSVWNGLCLQPASHGPYQGDPIIQETCNGSDDQRWNSIPAHQGSNLINASTGLCLDVQGGAAYKGTPIDQWPCAGDNGQSNQFWNYDGAFLQSGANPQPWLLCLTAPGTQAGQQSELQYCGVGSEPEFWYHP
jgi:hypothetical protein